MQRLFIGGEQPTLPQAVRVLRERHAISGDAWDLGRIAIAVPGSRAARRMLRLIQEEAARVGVTRLVEPEIMTPAALLRKVCGPANAAGPMACHFAWVRACEGAGDTDRDVLAPRTSGLSDPAAWVAVATEAQRARAATTAEGLSLAQAAALCASVPGMTGGAYREALAHLEGAYLDVLAEAGLCDLDAALADALGAGSLGSGPRAYRHVYLVGAQDLSGRERALLRALDMEIIALVPAEEDEQDKFDETGTLRIDAWHDAPIDIPDEVLQFVRGPAEEAEALRTAVAALGGAFALPEITVGAGDEASAESLARRLAVMELPSYSPFGRMLTRTRPTALLGATRDFLRNGTAGAFAALVRHPDMEAWLAARQAPNDAQAPDGAANALPLLSALDIYRTECLPRALPTGADIHALRTSPCPRAAKSARATVLDALEAAEALLAPLRNAARPLGAWSRPIADLLRTVFADMLLADDPEGRQFGRALAALAEILGEMALLPPTLAPTVSGADALGFVAGQAEAVRLPAEPDVAGGVGAGLEMMGWLELALDDAPVLLLTGLHEGCVPTAAGDDPLLPDSLRRVLGLADDRHRLARDGWLLRRMLESRKGAGRHVRLVVCRAGADGDPRLPSRLLFACGPEQAARRAALLAAPPHAATAPTPPLFGAGAGRALPPPRPAPPRTPLVEMSVSAFADYLACPYRFHLRHVLKLEEQSDAGTEMDPRLFGILLHDCLAAFARSEAAQWADAPAVAEHLRARLVSQSRERFGASPSRTLQVQVRQAERRLDAFAAWQAQSVRDGWTLQPDLSEKELTVCLVVDDVPFTVKGRVDRVDYHAGSDQYRILDYKTGDAGKDPDTKHRARGTSPDAGQWTDLQLPLYRCLLTANGASAAQVAPDALGYVLLSADLAPVAATTQGRRIGGTGFVPALWTQADHDDALRCAENVVRSIRAGVFWPPAHPSPLAPSRTDPGRSEAFGGLCLDSCSDRPEWFALSTEAAP